MVAFGKKLIATQIHEWQGYYINYKLLKKKVNQYSRQIENDNGNRLVVLKDFSILLDSQGRQNIVRDGVPLFFSKDWIPTSSQITSDDKCQFKLEKIVLFILEQQGIIARRLSDLREQQDDAYQHGVIVDVSGIREAYRAVGKDLLRLLFFVEMNAIALRKILKKFDKRLAYRFTDYYVKTRANHPYSQLQQIFKHVGFGAVMGAISRNLVALQDNEGSYISIYDQPVLFLQDPIVSSLRAAVDRLTNSTDFLHFLGKHALILQDDSPSPSEVDVGDKGYDLMSLLLNLTNAFLYMVNTYIIVPTADSYSLSLGAAATVCGAVIGSMAVAQMFSSFYFSAWSNKSYQKPLIFSSVILLIGNTLYAMAYDLNSISVLLIGRLFCGLGSARAVNRRYISDCVPQKMRMKASAGFVTASALGMACGPALACLFQTKFTLYKFTFNQDTLPGWFMALAWFIYLLLLCVSFKEPPKPELNSSPRESSHGHTAHDDAVENGFKDPLLLNSNKIQLDEDDDENEFDYNGEVSEDHKPATSIVAAYKLLTPSVKVQLLIYFMLKYAMEVLLAESSVVTEIYFLWSTRTVSIFLACLGLTVLPANVLIGNYISNLFEERQLLLVSQILLCIGIMLSFHVSLPYSVPQYVISALITFVSAEVLEGVNLSLLSRVMSSRLSRGTYNGGLLSTEAGTLARVIADSTITLAGFWGETKLLNMTLLPSLLICISSIIATCCTYNSLY